MESKNNESIWSFFKLWIKDVLHRCHWVVVKEVKDFSSEKDKLPVYTKYILRCKECGKITHYIDNKNYR